MARSPDPLNLLDKCFRYLRKLGYSPIMTETNGRPRIQLALPGSGEEQPREVRIGAVERCTLCATGNIPKMCMSHRDLDMTAHGLEHFTWQLDTSRFI